MPEMYIATAKKAMTGAASGMLTTTVVLNLQILLVQIFK